MDVDLIIIACTREGVTSWANVARMLGCSVDQARSRHDPRYLRPNPFRDREEQKLIALATLVAELDDGNAPTHKHPSSRIRILTYLATHSGTSADISARLGVTAKTVINCLALYLAEGLVTNDRPRSGGRTAITWTITPKGRTEASTRDRAVA